MRWLTHPQKSFATLICTTLLNLASSTMIHVEKAASARSGDRQRVESIEDPSAKYLNSIDPCIHEFIVTEQYRSCVDLMRAPWRLVNRTNEQACAKTYQSVRLELLSSCTVADGKDEGHMVSEFICMMADVGSRFPSCICQVMIGLRYAECIKVVVFHTKSITWSHNHHKAGCTRSQMQRYHQVQSMAASSRSLLCLCT